MHSHLSPKRGHPLSLVPPDDNGDDSGDISLSMSRTGSAATLAAINAVNSKPLRQRDVPSPTPRAALGKSLLSPTASASAHQQRTPGGANGTAGSNFAGPSRASPITPSRVGSAHATRQSSMLTPTTPNAQGSPTLSPGGGSINARRTLTRSRSLNVRIPTVDMGGERGYNTPDVSSATTSQHPVILEPGVERLKLNGSGIEPAPSPRPPPLVDNETAVKMRRWVKEVVVCNFDLERGPVVERRAVGRRWGPGEKENVAFSSFPDTSLFTEGSIQFSFKIRHIPPDPSSLVLPEPPSPLPDRGGAALPGIDNTLAPPRAGGHARGSSLVRDKEAEYRAWDERGREWTYGFVWFQQRRDRGIARGFMQKSVVILTHLPFAALFSEVLTRVAPSFFEYGDSALEVACHAIASWPDPTPDAILELPLMSDVLSVKLPDSTDNPQVLRPAPMPRSSLVEVQRPILASLPASTPLRAFATFLPSLWSLWECLVLAEPVLVIAPDPRTCSEIVWWLRELVRPIPLAGDFRPYLHIHDHDFSLLVNANKPQPGVVVGVTNPFFRNAASHWPNVISIPSDRPKPRGANAPKTEVPSGFISRRSRSIQKDRPLLKRLETLVAEGKLDDPAGNEALRTYFQQLTERFLVPLNRYFQTLVPPRSPAQPGARMPNSAPQSGTSTPIPPPPALSLATLKPFSLPTFLQHLKTHGPNPLAFKTRGLLTKSRVEHDFYAAFGMSATFAGWLGARVESIGIAVAAAHPMASWTPASHPDALVPHRLSPAPSTGTSRSSADYMSSAPPSGSVSASPSVVGVAIRASDDTPRVPHQAPFDGHALEEQRRGSVPARERRDPSV